MAQAVSRSSPTVGVTPCRFRGERIGICVGFSHGVSRFRQPKISFHYFSTLTSLNSFYFISFVVDRHLCYSQTISIGALFMAVSRWPCSNAAVISLVHPRANIPYPQARLCYCGWKWVNSGASGGTLVP